MAQDSVIADIQESGRLIGERLKDRIDHAENRREHTMQRTRTHTMLIGAPRDPKRTQLRQLDHAALRAREL
jgi:hypothetical protein